MYSSGNIVNVVMLWRVAAWVTLIWQHLRNGSLGVRPARIWTQDHLPLIIFNFLHLLFSCCYIGGTQIHQTEEIGDVFITWKTIHVWRHICCDDVTNCRWPGRNDLKLSQRFRAPFDYTENPEETPEALLMEATVGSFLSIVLVDLFSSFMPVFFHRLCLSFLLIVYFIFFCRSFLSTFFHRLCRSFLSVFFVCSDCSQV